MALSKKQQKTLAFRQKQKAKKTGEAVPGDVPEADPVDEDDANVSAEQEPLPIATAITAVETEQATPGPASGSGAAKKRKRDVESSALGKGETGGSDLTGGLKSKVRDVGKGKGKAWDEDGDAGEDGDAEGSKAKKSKKEAKQRFILFVGNLSYKTTREDVQAHFKSAVGSIPAVRLLTTKPTTPTAKPKSRGIAFLEVPSSEAMQACLKLHHSQLAGRRVNVELTAGGGGGGEKRKEKLAERNKRVGQQRVKRAERVKAAAAAEGGDEGEVTAEAETGAEEQEKKRPKKEGKGSSRPIGEGGEAAPGAEKEAVDVSGVAGVQDGSIKMRGGRRVKVKAKTQSGTTGGHARAVPPHMTQTNTSGALPGWQDRQAARPPQKSRRKQWEPTGANALMVG